MLKKLNNYFFPLALLITAGNLHASSFLADTVITQPKGVLKAKVVYSAKDSIRFDITNQRVYLFGNAKVNYEKMELKAAMIELDLKNKLVHAEGTRDSLGKETGIPYFSDGEHASTGRKISYNFESKKGKISDIIAKEGEGYIHGETVKKDTNNVTYIKHGSYTTCELADPHFEIKAKKLKIIPDDKIITGPAFLVVEDVPTPLGIPFGYFPNKKGQSSGILVPAYGESNNLGFFLRDGGYYFGFSDYVDLAIRGDIYSYGSYALKTHSNYRKRYKYNGNLNISYSKILIGDPDAIDPSEQNDFFVRWNHTQDGKARPGTSFLANVNAGSSNYNTFNANNANAYLSNTFQSNIAYTKAWKRSSLSANARHSQNTLTKRMDISLPELTYNWRPVLENKKRIGTGWGYDKIRVGYVVNAKNELTTYDTIIFKESPLRRMRNGLRHSIPVSTSFQALKYVTITPAITGYSTWYMQTIEKRFDPTADAVVTDTIKGFKMFNEFSTSVNASTRLYGMYTFRNSKMKALRHVITPNIGISYRPDFADPQFGYYKSVVTNPTGQTQEYSIFEGGIYGAPPSGKSGFVSWSLNNNLEAKVRQRTDTSDADKKITLIEALNISSGYNLAAENFNWSAITINGRTKLFNVLDINANTTLDPYRIDSTGRRIERFEWYENKRVGRLTNANLAIGTNLRSREKKNTGPKTSTKGTPEELEDINRHPEAYIDFNVPWSLNIYYNITYSKPQLVEQVIQSLNFNGDFSLTPKWKIGFNSGYDFKNNDFTYTSVNVYRDLHCWEMRFNWIPFGFRQSYTVDIKVKSSVLQDLKLSRKRDWYDYQ